MIISDAEDQNMGAYCDFAPYRYHMSCIQLSKLVLFDLLWQFYVSTGQLPMLCSYIHANTLCMVQIEKWIATCACFFQYNQDTYRCWSLLRCYHAASIWEYQYPKSIDSGHEWVWWSNLQAVCVPLIGVDVRLSHFLGIQVRDETL